jgi:hypothetical protein
MTWLEILIVVNLAVSLVGGAIVVKWVRALKGTVDAQAETITTIQKVNETVLNVFTALDPERYAREVATYKDLADKKTTALVEEAQRQAEAQRTALADKAGQVMVTLSEMYGEALGLAVGFMPWVPKKRRADMVAEAKLPGDVKKNVMDLAEKAPDWSTHAVGFAALEAIARELPTGAVARGGRVAMEMLNAGAQPVLTPPIEKKTD